MTGKQLNLSIEVELNTVPDNMAQLISYIAVGTALVIKGEKA